ncbi:acetate/propionate family kinase [Acetobacterium sp.]|jgi:acetate kinase|uniref:acetate/propionate family kinase n=1 Tax=Acetobacterium sp. TaxID=1872094 RepID=UPI0027255E3F|nr:acetate/propionate family kinase [Acetobacterium sp.]MDO9493870.1 acetate/propionate family kinase [Acetobacterium sp.]
MIILVLNCGSSSVKFQVCRMPEYQVLVKGSIGKIGYSDAEFKLKIKDHVQILETLPIKDHESGINLILNTLKSRENSLGFALTDLAAVGHRVVQGGEQCNNSIPITPAIIDYIESIKDLAPLHNPHHLSGIYACAKLLPGIPQIAAFDNGFHMTLPRHAYLYALPLELTEKYKIRRYGFHGIAFRSMVAQAEKFLPKGHEGYRIVNMMLGSGTTANAVYYGTSIDVSTGFTPQEGLIQSTRAGDMDAAALLYLMKKENMSLSDADTMINKKSGWLGLSGMGNDMRDIYEASLTGNQRAIDTIATVCHRFRKYIGAYAAEMGGLDLLIFSGGVGENAWYIREAVCVGLEFMGIVLDPHKNRELSGEGLISTASSAVQILVVSANEEKIIAEDTFGILDDSD